MKPSTGSGDEVVCEARRTGHFCVFVLVLLRALIWRTCLRVGTRLLPLSMSTRRFNELEIQFPTPNQVVDLIILRHSLIVSLHVTVEVKLNALSVDLEVGQCEDADWRKLRCQAAVSASKQLSQNCQFRRLATVTFWHLHALSFLVSWT